MDKIYDRLTRHLNVDTKLLLNSNELNLDLMKKLCNLKKFIQCKIMCFSKLILFLALLLGFTDAEAQHQLDQLNIGPPLILSPADSVSKDPFLAVEMPTVDFPKEAKILVWRPDSSIVYTMPNALSPDDYVSNIERFKGNKPKKDENGGANQ